MDIEFNSEIALRLVFSFLIGTAIGLEREYRSKAAGLRTMIMICLGSTIFTLISIVLTDNSPDRIASNVITGIGFLGAGVIFKDGLSVSGITTATTIWVCAALGMAVGAGQYFIAIVGSVGVLIILTLLESVKKLLARYHQSRAYKITCNLDPDFSKVLEHQIRLLKLDFVKERDMKIEENTILGYEIFGHEHRLDELNTFLKNSAQVKSYEY